MVTLVNVPFSDSAYIGVVEDPDFGVLVSADDLGLASVLNISDISSAVALHCLSPVSMLVSTTTREKLITLLSIRDTLRLAKKTFSLSQRALQDWVFSVVEPQFVDY